MRNNLIPFARRRTADSQAPGSGWELTESERQALPARFDAVAEALVSGTSPVAACVVAGRALASDGASLGEVLAGLRATCVAVGTVAPELDAVEALSVAWSEATLEFLHDVSCEDPLTGLASLPHLRTRLAEVYREAERTARPVKESHALLVVDVGGGAGGDVPTDTFSRALRLATVADALRTVLSGEETIAKVGAHRVVALVRRTPELGDTVAVGRAVLDDLDAAARTWIEGLPSTPENGVRLLSELAR
jgi:GGDEF domain-containing protein